MREVKLDLRPRCLRCRKIPRGKMQQANYDRYRPYCSFHCQQWHGLEEAAKAIRPNPTQDREVK